ncbi:MAG TPA: alanine racemase [Candidatus Krumholzibacteria bacterium]|nr:alanine racemase [Candidatus Krumholzibacteria bacterium]
MKRLPTWLEIDLDRLDKNLGHIQAAVGDGVGILLTVKADAYGHGAVQVAAAASSHVRLFGVATVDEALELQEAGIRNGLLILSPILETEVPVVAEHGFAITLSSAAFVEAIARHSPDRPLDVHVEIDTGMGRSGVAEADAFDEIVAIAQSPAVKLRGVYTHFPVSDSDAGFTRAQVGRFLALVAKLRAAGVTIPLVHSANSAAVDGVAEAHMDMVRPGLLAYGLHPAGGTPGIDVAPIMSWKSRLVRVRRVPAGHNISYGRSFTTARDSVIGVVPVGYGHGYPLRLSGRGSMLVSGRRVPIVGRVTMDMTMVDLTDLPEVPREGDGVVLVGTQGGETISFHDLAAWADTICYEIMCMISKRVPRTYFRRGKVETFKTLLGVIPNHVAV